MTDSVNSVSRLRVKRSRDRTLRSSLLIHKSEELRLPHFTDPCPGLENLGQEGFGRNSQEHEVSSHSHSDLDLDVLHAAEMACAKNVTEPG